MQAGSHNFHKLCDFNHTFCGNCVRKITFLKKYIFNKKGNKKI